MKLKFNHKEFLLLYNLLQAQYTIRPGTTQIIDSMVEALRAEMLLKLHGKILIKKKEYSIRLSPAQAAAFWIMFNTHIFPHSSFEGHVLTTLCNHIHQQLQIPQL